MRTKCLLAAISFLAALSVGCSKPSVSDCCGSGRPIDYDGVWKTTGTVHNTNVYGNDTTHGLDFELIIDQMGDSVSFSGIVARSNDEGLYFGSSVTYQDMYFGRVSVEYTGAAVLGSAYTINLNILETLVDEEAWTNLAYRLVLSEKLND